VTNVSGSTWYIIFRNQNQAMRVYERRILVPPDVSAMGAAETSATNGKSAAAPRTVTFVPHSVVAPPR